MRILLFLQICTSFLPALASTLANVSIDDTYGDERTGLKPVYGGGWSLGQNCLGCGMADLINASVPYNKSWHDITWHPPGQGVASVPLNITLSFTGVAIYAFCLLGNNAEEVTTYTGIDFVLDGQPAGSFSHTPNETTAAIQYNASVFSRSSLSNSAHTLMLMLNGGNQSALMLFDYALYTVMEDDVNSTSTGVTTTTATFTSTASSQTSTNSTLRSRASLSAGAISGIVVGTLFALVAVVIGAFLFRMRRRKGLQDEQASEYSPQPMLEHVASPTTPFTLDAGERETIRTQGKADSSSRSGARTQDTLLEEIVALRQEMERMRADDAESQERNDNLMEMAALGVGRPSRIQSLRPPSTVLPSYVDEASSHSRAGDTES